MDYNPSIEYIYIERLHEQFDVELKLGPGLNVIYGKNGRGKTTILHILANILELDFRRFMHLRFAKIELRTHSGNTLSIVRLDSGKNVALVILINGEQASVVDGESDISPAEKELVRKVIGQRAVYLPAFRSILDSSQRARENYRYYAELQQSDAYKEIVALEKNNRGESQRFIGPDRYRADRSIEGVALKTVQCREWFGKFVPMIRYPSLGEVEELLGEEWSHATYQLARSEDQMFTEVFVRVFESILGDESTNPEKGIRALLDDLSSSIAKLDISGNSSRKVYSRISEAVNHSLDEFSKEEETAKRVLNLYVDFLNKRVDAQSSTFENLKAFEKSVNFFLDPKEFFIEQSGAPHRRPRALVNAQSKKRAYSITSLSSGERQVLTMLFCASRLSVDHGIFLVDEPELSLHVDWQRCILGELMKQAGDRQIIACTHSPEVGGDHPEVVQWFEPRSSREELDFEEVDSEEG
jgi:predicted ATPase